MKKNKHIKNLKNACQSGLGLFLITGLTGCDTDNNKCKDMSMLPQKQLEECRHRGGSFIPIWNSGTSKSSGYFVTGGSHSDISSGG